LDEAEGCWDPDLNRKVWSGGGIDGVHLGELCDDSVDMRVSYGVFLQDHNSGETLRNTVREDAMREVVRWGITSIYRVDKRSN